MTRRTRFLSGLLFLVAMSFSLVEGVYGLMCGPEMGESGTDVVATEGMGGMLMDQGPRPDQPHNGFGEREGGASCPFAFPGKSNGCTASALLLVAVAAPDLPSPEGVARFPMADVGPHLLLVSSIFHPPKP